MLDFASVRNKAIKLHQLAGDLTSQDLHRLTEEMVAAELALMADCVDADVIFEPQDPGADDPYAATEAEKNVPWTLGHLIAHVTASSEEAAVLASELARGVTFHGRSRYEVPWTEITTMAQCRQRLEESLRMRLASLKTWPDLPHMENTYKPYEKSEPLNPITRFLAGLMHDDSHLDQMVEVVRQAHAARGNAGVLGG
jgi:hypothetical protein